jgi:hypothetical protein
MKEALRKDRHRYPEKESTVLFNQLLSKSGGKRLSDADFANVAECWKKEKGLAGPGP